ncbi:MAG: hypothetical protein LLG04_08690, partial [Parachlamydia sp.]|nr:hypothetical protein [Parachlamydia sp.]
KYFCPLGSLMVSGNIKLPRTTGIFNMSSATHCPSRKLGLCKAEAVGVKCYALKSEVKSRPNVLPFRDTQEKFWEKVTAKQFVSQFLILNVLKGVPYTKIRFNESGDFHSQKCINKAEEIAKMLHRFGIRVYCYTSRDDLDFSKCRHLIVSGSGFMKEGISNEFRIVYDLKERPKGYGICKGDCRVCNRCTMRNLRTVIKKH